MTPELRSAPFAPGFGGPDRCGIVVGEEFVRALDMAGAVEEIEPVLASSARRRGRRWDERRIDMQTPTPLKYAGDCIATGARVDSSEQRLAQLSFGAAMDAVAEEPERAMDRLTRRADMLGGVGAIALAPEDVRPAFGTDAASAGFHVTRPSHCSRWSAGARRMSLSRRRAKC